MNLEDAAEAIGVTRRWLEAHPEKIDAVEAWAKRHQESARAALNPWTWLKEHAQSGRLGDEAETIFEGPRSLLMLIEDDGFGLYAESPSTISHARWNIANQQKKQ